jgi:hypothetical protein
LGVHIREVSDVRFFAFFTCVSVFNYKMKKTQKNVAYFSSTSRLWSSPLARILPIGDWLILFWSFRTIWKRRYNQQPTHVLFIGWLSQFDLSVKTSPAAAAAPTVHCEEIYFTILHKHKHTQTCHIYS